MTIAQKSKETTLGMKDGNGINLCSLYPAYIYVHYCTSYNLKLPDILLCRDCWLDIQNNPFTSLPLSPYFFEQCVIPTFFSFHGNVFSL